LRALGLQAGDRVAMLSLNSDRYLEYQMGVPWAGGVLNPCNTRWSAAEIVYALNDSGSTILLVDETFRPLAEKFRADLETQFGADPPAMITTPLFYRDLPGYRIGVHPDAPYKVATLQFYLPADESQIHLGTTFHERTGHGFRELKTNPFRPNSAYGFVRTDESWHSVKTLGAHEHKRNTIALTFYHRGFQYRSEM